MKKRFYFRQGSAVKIGRRRISSQLRDWAGRVFAFASGLRQPDSPRTEPIRPRMTKREIKTLTRQIIWQVKDE